MVTCALAEWPHGSIFVVRATAVKGVSTLTPPWTGGRGGGRLAVLSAQHARGTSERGSAVTGLTCSYREFLSAVISPMALSLLERLTPVITDIYQLDALLEAELPLEQRAALAERFTDRLRRIVALLPPHVSPMPNEIFTAVEFLLYEVRGEPIRIGLAIARLEELAEEFRADPLLHSLISGRAN